MSNLLQKLWNALTELEELKPIVQQKINELNRKHLAQVNGMGHLHQGSSSWTPVRRQTMTYNNNNKVKSRW